MTLRLDRLDRVIQAAMGWTNSHLHMFIHPTGHYGTPCLDFPLRDESKAAFRDLAAREGDTFGYEYDFGDSWTHEVLLEELVSAEPTGRYPACTDGARACPPEDCGGTTGYQELLDALADPHHTDHDDLRRWLGLEQGADFDPARFDPADANRRIATVMIAGRLGR
ncbi:plasmid pRiA4b ORF-3 family protein [Actinoplanes sp. GCM10030250]|uniref:plasmid pRiA4b ORF-3 family protein n=1 Tax=Actinoplanes sp. GCM10030250 TaxID=3273376 RepID=UPI003617F470